MHEHVGSPMVALALAVVLFGAVVFTATTNYQRRSVVVREVQGRAHLAAVHSVRVVSAWVTPDGRHLFVGKVAGLDGCGQLSSVRVTRQRAVLGVRIQMGNEPSPGACSLVGSDETRTISLRHRVDTNIRLVQPT